MGTFLSGFGISSARWLTKLVFGGVMMHKTHLQVSGVPTA